MSHHEHAYNATLISRRGRCACGAWAKWTRERVWEPVTARMWASLDDRLARYRDPEVPYPYAITPPSNFARRERDSTADVVEHWSRRRIHPTEETE